MDVRKGCHIGAEAAAMYLKKRKIPYGGVFYLVGYCDPRLFQSLKVKTSKIEELWKDEDGTWFAKTMSGSIYNIKSWW